MFDFEPSKPSGFHADFALSVLLPLAEAAYAVMNRPGAAPILPPGFEMTGLIQADESLRQAILNQPGQANVAKAMMKDSAIFGLLGKNSSTKTGFIAFRGTETFEDWIADFDSFFEPYKYIANAGHVHMGFQSVYGAIRDSIETGVGAAVAGCEQLLITGHSLGGAVAVIAAPDIAKTLAPVAGPEVTTFAAPAAGLIDFTHFFNSAIPACSRVVNFWDVVPRLPPQIPVGFYEQAGTRVDVDAD